MIVYSRLIMPARDFIERSGFTLDSSYTSVSGLRMVHRIQECHR